jgi:excisionase family DNA binding protein
MHPWTHLPAADPCAIGNELGDLSLGDAVTQQLADITAAVERAELPASVCALTRPPASRIWDATDDMASTDPDEYLTVAEVAGVLKLNQQTVRNWIDRGELPALRVGRRVRILRSDFDALIQSAGGTRPAPAPPPPSIWDGVLPEPVLPEDL